MCDPYKTVETVIPANTSVTLPLFNVVDEQDSTQESLAKAVAEVWNIKYGFLNSTVAALVQQFAKASGIHAAFRPRVELVVRGS